MNLFIIAMSRNLALGVESRKRAREASPEDAIQSRPVRRRRHSVSTDMNIAADPMFVVSLRKTNEKVFRDGLIKSVTWQCESACFSLDMFMSALSVKVAKVLKDSVRNRLSVKAYLDVHLTYVNCKNASDRKRLVLRTKAVRVLRGTDLQNTLSSMTEQLDNRNVNFIRNKSGMILDSVDWATLHIAQYNSLAGSSYKRLPDALSRKKAIINVRNTDNRCFGYAILAAKYSDVSHKKDAGDPQPYNKFFAREKLDKLKYPVKIDDLESIEQRLGQAINVLSFYDARGEALYSVYHSKLAPERADNAINLMYWDKHFAWIKSFERLMGNITKHKARKYFCMRCFSHFSCDRVLQNHKEICTGDACQQVMTMVPEGTILKFQNTRYQQMFPFVIYADFECLPRNITDRTNVSNNPFDVCPELAYQHHEPCSAGIVLVSTLPELNLPYEEHFGTDVCAWFLNRIVEIEAACLRVLFNENRLVMSVEDTEKFNASRECYLCGRAFAERQIKVRDHDHVTGRFRGAAHQGCNLQLRKQYKIPVFLHNFRGYDCHLIVAALGVHKDRKLNVIGQGMEKYLCLSFGDHIVFKDSLQFVQESLETLVSSLCKSGRAKFKNLLNGFNGKPDDTVDLLLRKGVYPYDYMNSWDRFKEHQLPSVDAFCSKLRQESCAAADYEHAQRVWNTFKCETLKDYHDLYLKTDVLLLADVFEEFRKVCMTNYKLDPAHYVSAPQLSWDAMLKMTECNLELISDSEMYRMLDNSLRGGITMISKRYSRANNPRLGAQYDPTNPEKHIMYLDANNLYGWAMSQYLPTDGFRWLEDTEIADIAWITLKKRSPTGYFIECDLEYPSSLHDAHNDYPLAPERVRIVEKMLSDKQRDIHTHYNFNRSASYTKLVPNLFSKEKYCLHYRNLKFYLKHGLVLKKVHRVIQFNQSDWMRKYIEMNQNLRAAATDDFEKKFYKGMNNSCYGKTCENQRKRTDIKLVTDESKAKKYLQMPHLIGFKVFTKDIAAVNLMKSRCIINRPFYVGFAVLELSKLHMYRFHYDFVKRHYPGDQSQLLFTDTDSLMYEISATNVYELMWDNREKFDLSEYPKDFYRDDTNNKVIGKFKDETSGMPIVEFVGLRPKMYSFVALPKPGSDVVCEKARAKGIQRAALKRLRHADYVCQLRNPTENRLTNRRIGSNLHQIYTYEYEKRGLCAFDDKRYIMDDGISTLSYGHYRLSGEDTSIEVALPKSRKLQTFAQAAESGLFSSVAHNGEDVRNDERITIPSGLDPDQVLAEKRLKYLCQTLGRKQPRNMLDLVPFVKP